MSVLVKFENFQLAQYQKQILKDISFSIHRGEKIALVGPSGAGKSTLLTEIYRRLGDNAALCPQQLGLVDALSVYHNIYMAQLGLRPFLLNLWNLFVPLPGARRDIKALAEEFGLGSMLDRVAVNLSGGERQRLALARACYRSRSVFLGDEPVSNLDPVQGQHLLAGVCARHKTVVVAVHSPKLALGNFHRVIGLRDGALQFDLVAAEVTGGFLADFYRGS